MNDREEKKRRFTLIINQQVITNRREELQRRLELEKFIKACEALYEKNRRNS